MTDARYNPALHRVALLTTAATFPLIFMGGLVTSHGAGMSVPDWPNTYGYNMFLFPPRLWVGGILYEHTHRLMGTVVGFCAILLALCAWGPARDTAVRRGLRRCAAALLALAAVAVVAPFTYHNNDALTRGLRHAAVGLFSLFLVFGSASMARGRDDRRWVRWLTLAVLMAVVVQGVLGGLRVALVELDLAVVHACFAQAFFCLAALVAVVTSPRWHDPANCGAEPAADPAAPPAANPAVRRFADRAVEPAFGRATVRFAAVAVLAIYLQLVAGALMRHHGAGLAIPDLPLAYGKLVPPVSAEGLGLVNEVRVWDAGLARVTLGQVWLHFSHRVGAIVVSVAVVAAAVRVLRRDRRRELTTPAIVALALLAAQVTLGVFTVLYRKPADVASAHVAVGALLLLTMFVITVRAARLNRAAVCGEDRAPSRAAEGSAARAMPNAETIRGGAELAPA